MFVNLTSFHIYALQFWMCTTKHLNLYKIDTNVLYDILHGNLCPPWCPTCIVTSRIRQSICLSLYKFKCLFVDTQSLRTLINIFMYYI